MPRKRSSDSPHDRARIQFAYNADLGTPIGEVFRYLLKNDQLPSRQGKHRGLDAMLAFWQPFAYQLSDQLSDEEKERIARESIDALTRQVDLIRETFGIEAPPAESGMNPARFKQEIRSVVSEVVQEFVAVGAFSAATQATQSMPEGSEGVDFDEDALLGGLFDNADIAA